ncbi:uncharacterized protein BCR38DRAFT_122894 [Pseudomassariella vexata]|uniref:Uncharacterized protein n=1 Tax=Pseudomassariella vexata TaxID=1141098 RepID=A0A1Y2D8Q4_9PEZI|nr:uncharacterized protein BCR38DRAFT_122894 [Pseudomassariella vexata]ORY55642.1 hypothetical protein BCR38DRAFT_122894 [Pseudomassariella vexata]
MIWHFCFDYSYNALDVPNFRIDVRNSIISGAISGKLIRQFRLVTASHGDAGHTTASTLYREPGGGDYAGTAKFTSDA